MKKLTAWVLIVAGACQGITNSPDYQQASVQLLSVDSSLFDSGLLCRALVADFYAKRGNELFWSDTNSFRPIADSMFKVLNETPYYGLSNKHYHQEELAQLVADSTQPQRGPRIDVLLTDSFLALYFHLKYGRIDPGSHGPRDLTTQPDQKGILALSAITPATLRASLESNEPRFKEYAQLKHALRNLLTQPGDTLTDAKVRTLAINMERWRWQKSWPERYVVVNIPSYMLQVIEADSLWLETKVIVGKRTTPTPVMESVINSFIIYPYWHVPRSIATKEILPHLQRDVRYLQQNNFDVLDKKGTVVLADTIQWDAYSRDFFPFVLRQREGSENSMGIIRFNFANSYGVYLHDTNSKRLFELTRRDLSHGCVRVKNAVALAQYLVKDDDIYVSPQDLDQYLSLKQRLPINLRKPIPLKLEYFTAEVKGGRLFLYDDIYKKDSVMIHAMDHIPHRSPSAARLAQTGD